MKHGISPTTPNNWERGRPRRFVVMMKAAGKNRDPGRVMAHKAHRGPLIRATGPGSYAEESPQQIIARKRREKALRVTVAA